MKTKEPTAKPKPAGQAKAADAPKAVPASKPVEERIPFEEHATEAGTPAWLLAATIAKHGWPRQLAMTRKQFDQAVDQARKERIQ